MKYSSPTSLSPKAPTADNYTTILSLHRGTDAEQYVKNFLLDHPWHGRLIIVYNENNEHIEAMAASDVGIVYDGQIAGVAAACHLPTMVLI